MNIILQTDSYKLTHWNQYPSDTEGVYSYFESRPGAKWDYTVFFGLQYLLEKYLVGSVINKHNIDEAEDFIGHHLGNKSFFNRAGWTHILNEHGGYLPIKIEAVPEGMRIPTSNVLMTVANTDARCYWLTNYIETLLTHVWYPSTVATLSHTTKEMFKKYLDKSADTQDALPFMLHDFGYRGATSEEAAGIGGAAHLLNFMGTDTIAGMLTAMKWYYAKLDSLAFSVPATEHSVMTSLGRDGEISMLDHVLQQYPTGIVSVVADSYDIYAFTKEVCERKDVILARDGRFVLRPDSVTSENKTPESLVNALMNLLWDTFGGEKNSKGYRVLDPHIRLLWGDGIDQDGIGRILDRLTDIGFSAENMVFGMGGGLLQKVNRDTQRFAFKASAQYRKGVWHNVWKQPLDPSKTSKKGRFKLIDIGENGESKIRTTAHDAGGTNILRTVFQNGDIVVSDNFQTIRDRTNA